jgi:hypothetical protein
VPAAAAAAGMRVKWLNVTRANAEYRHLSFNHIDFVEKCRQRLQFEAAQMVAGQAQACGSQTAS